MRNGVLARLRKDHARFERFFVAIERECAKAEEGGPIDQKRVRAIMGYLGTSAPAHHAVEDAIYAQIVKVVPRFSEEVFDLLDDHEVGTREFANLTRALEENKERFVEMAKSFVANERGHFIAEEEIVFPYAAQHLNAEQWRTVGQLIPRRETPAPSVDNTLIADLLAPDDGAEFTPALGHS